MKNVNKTHGALNINTMVHWYAGHCFNIGCWSFHAWLTIIVFATRFEPGPILIHTHVLLNTGHCCNSNYQELSQKIIQFCIKFSNTFYLDFKIKICISSTRRLDVPQWHQIKFCLTFFHDQVCAFNHRPIIKITFKSHFIKAHLIRFDIKLFR